MKSVKFEAIIKESQIGKGGAYIEFPYNTEEIFGKKGRIPVICHFENIEYRGSLVKMGTDCHIIGIRKEIMQKLNKKIGDKISVNIEEDKKNRTITIDHELLKFLEENKLFESFSKLSYTKQKEINDSIQNAKKEETKKTRFEKIKKILL